MNWQVLLVIIGSGVVLVGGTSLVLYIVHLKRSRAQARAERNQALDVVARYHDREEILDMTDEELHDEALDLLARYHPDDSYTG